MKANQNLWITVVITIMSLMLLFSACSNNESNVVEEQPPAEGPQLETIQPGKLTLGTFGLPYPGYLNGVTVDGEQDGFTWELANALAERFGLDEVEIVIVNFSAATAGLETDFDIFAHASPTPERQKVGEYSVPILANESVMFAHKDTPSATLEDLKGLQWGISQGSAPGAVVEYGVQPDIQPRIYNGMMTLVPSLLTDQIDAAIGSVADFAPYYGLDDYKDYKVLAQVIYESDKTSAQSQAFLMPKGSKNVDAINDAIQDFTEQGLIDQWYEEYVVPAMGGVNLNDVPKIIIEE